MAQTHTKSFSPKPSPVKSVSLFGPPINEMEASPALDIVAFPESSAELQRLFSRYPQLRGQLREIYAATTEPFNSTLNEHRHARTRGDRNRRGITTRDQGIGQSYGSAWTRRNSLVAGLDQLEMSRQLYSKCGEGLQAFCELVIWSGELKAPEPR